MSSTRAWLVDNEQPRGAKGLGALVPRGLCCRTFLGDTRAGGVSQGPPEFKAGIKSLPLGAPLSGPWGVGGQEGVEEADGSLKGPSQSTDAS